MPCYQQVKIELALKLSDRVIIEETVHSVRANIEADRIYFDDLTFQIQKDGSVTSTVATVDEERANSFLNQLKREYTLNTINRWAKSQRFNIRRRGNKIQARMWV